MGAKTIPLGQAPSPMGAKTIPLGQPPSPMGAKTIPLGQPPGGPSGKATVPLGGGPQPLPQATVKMSGTQPMGSVVGSPRIKPVAGIDDEELEEENADAGMLPFAIGALILAIALLIVEIMTNMSTGV